MPLTEKRPRKILIITSSGGGGLLQAATAKEQEFKAQDPDVIIVRRDVMKDWVWKGFGAFCVRQWNQAQLRGNVMMQRIWGMFAPIAECLFWPQIFFSALYTLFKEDIDRVVDTQIMGTSATIKALRYFNRRTKKQVRLEKVFVDLPTKKATHFFTSIRWLNKKDRELFRLITIQPMLEEGQTAEQFWKTHCNLTPRELQYESYYVRRSFLHYRGLERKKEATTLCIRYHNQEEFAWLQKSIGAGPAQITLKPGEIHFAIEPEALVFTLLLGSQPANQATLTYVEKFLALSGELRGQHPPVYLFVFCANHEMGKPSLLQKVSERVSRWGLQLPLTIIPMSFQEDDVIAPLFFRSDMTCTRSGGQTAMELLSVSHGEIWIHSEAKIRTDSATNEELLQGIPGWESANAAYLQSMRSAKIVTTDTFVPLAKAILTSR